MRATALAEWCGARKGRARTSPPPESSPATEYILVASSASSNERGGKMPGRRFANMLLPVPGGPISRALCPPAAATSSARRASGWPRTSAKSRKLSAACGAYGVCGCGKMGASPERWRTTSRAVCTG